MAIVEKMPAPGVRPGVGRRLGIPVDAIRARLAERGYLARPRYVAGREAADEAVMEAFRPLRAQVNDEVLDDEDW